MAVPASALIENHPEGVFRFTNVVFYEKSAYRIKFRVLQNTEPVDFTGCAVDYAQVDGYIKGIKLIDLTVTLGTDGWVTVVGNPAQMTETLAPHSLYPNGMSALMTIRLKDASNNLFYLVAPSRCTIKHAPGANT